jgi:hypothetical protein
MKTIFQSQRHPEVIIKVDLTDVNIKAKLFAWFNFKHNELFNELGMWEGGEVDIWHELVKSEMEYRPIIFADGLARIEFSGDNGLLELTEVKVEDLSELKLTNLVTNLI